jgi:hypothetical protein
MVVFLFGGVPDLTSLISEWPLNLGVGIFGLYLSGYFIGKWMETRICKRK